MDANHHDDPRDHKPASLSSPEYRTKLLTKLNCLIAVLEVAIAKISRSIDTPEADADRLTRIRSNLENTLLICNRAKQTLERSAPGPTSRPRLSSRRGRKQMTYRDYVELSSIEEYRKFKTMPPITNSDLSEADIDDLIRKLNEA